MIAASRPHLGTTTLLSFLHIASIPFPVIIIITTTPSATSVSLTAAYAEIWLDENLVAGGSVDVEPIYGKEYLPVS